MVKKIKPSEESTRKARKTALYERFKDNEKYFSFVFRRRSITYSLAGYTIRFEKDKEDRISRLGGDHIYLTDADYAFLFHFTKMLFKAREAGDKEARREKAEEKKARQLHNKEESELFANLPTQLNPKAPNRRRKT